MGGLRMRNAQQLESMMALPPIAAPDTNAQRPATAYFNASTNEMFAGDQQFSADDTRSALVASQSPGNTTKPVGPGWTALPEGAYGDYVASFAQRRGKMELIGRGFGDVAEGTIGGVGALMEFGGATEAGPAVREFAQGTFGQSENEQLRDQLISQNSTLLEKLIDGTFRAIPSVASVVVGGGAAGLGARALGAGATGIKAAATIGGGASSFPLHVDSYYQAAVQNGYDPTDPQIKAEIIGGAMANTALDMFGISSATGKIVSRALRQTAEEAGKKAARGAIFNGVMGGAKTGFSEALTETMQAIGETALFDPKAREMWGAGELKALAPYLADTYGEQYLIAGGIGAILGGGMGTAANLRATKAKTDIGTDKPVDLKVKATEQVEGKAAALALPGAEPSAAELEADALDRAWRNLPDQYGNTPFRDQLSPEEEALASGWETTFRTQEEEAAAAQAATEQAAADQAAAAEQAATDQARQAAQQRMLQPVSLIRRGVTEPGLGTGTGGRIDTLAPGDQRLRTRPSERVETYAPAAATADQGATDQDPNYVGPIGEQLRAAAAPAAKAPIKVTRIAPHIAGTPVILLLK